MQQTEQELKVNEMVVLALGVEEEAVTPEAHLVTDLGAESIDFLDLTFRMERGFNIKIPRDELFPESIFQMNEEYFKNDKITDQGMEHLRKSLPFYDNFGQVETERTKDSVKSLFTVGFIHKYIDWKLKL